MISLLLALAPVLDTPSPIPPLKFQRDSVEVVLFVEEPGLVVGCEPSNPKFVTRGCTLVKEKVVVVPNPCAYPEQNYARVLCHELGHLQGWEHPRFGTKEYDDWLVRNKVQEVFSHPCPNLCTEDPSPVSRLPSPSTPPE